MNVGTPHDSMPAVVLRDRPLSDSEWVEIIGRTRSLVNPLLDKISLMRLKDVKVPSSVVYKEKPYPRLGRVYWHEINEDEPKYESSGASGYSEIMQGFFFSRIRLGRLSTGEILVTIHGLTRGGAWFIGTTELLETGTKLVDLKVLRVSGQLFGDDDAFVREMVHHYIDWRNQLTMMVDGIFLDIDEQLGVKQAQVNKMRIVRDALALYSMTLKHIHAPQKPVEQ